MAHCDAFRDALSKLLFDAGEYAFSCFSNGEDLLLSGSETGYHLAFLEIHLSGAMNGLETAGQLRCLHPDTDIIFLTEAAEYVTEGYRYHAFDFLIKPVSMARLQDVIGRYLEERMKRPADFLNVSVSRSQVQLPLNEIRYLESQKRKIIAHMGRDDTGFYGRLDQLEDLLKDSGFIRCHQSYLVNSRHIRRFAGTLIRLSDGTVLPVSRTYMKKIKERSGKDRIGKEEEAL